MTYCVLFVNSYIYRNNDNDMKQFTQFVYKNPDRAVALVGLAIISIFIVFMMVTGYVIHLEKMAEYAR